MTPAAWRAIPLSVTPDPTQALARVAPIRVTGSAGSTLLIRRGRDGARPDFDPAVAAGIVNHPGGSN